MNTPDYSLIIYALQRGIIVTLAGGSTPAAVSGSMYDPNSKFGEVFVNTPAHYFTGGEVDRTGMSWASAYSGLSTYLNIPGRAYGLRNLCQMMTTIHIFGFIILWMLVGHGLGMILVK